MADSQTAATMLSRREASTSSDSGGIIRRSIHAMSDMLSPFSSSALASLPKNPQGFREREVRTDRIPEDGEVANYGATAAGLPPRVRVPKKIATPIKVEGKVWLACERTWISYMNMSILLGTLSLALFNSSSDIISRRFAYTYALISIAVLVYGYVVYQQRITMIRKRDPGHYDQIVGPVLIGVALFCAVLVNFGIRVREMQQRKEFP